MKNGIFFAIFLFILILALGFLFFILISRTVGHREVDDIHPLIPCNEDYINNSKWLYVIPLYMGDPITNYPSWCKRMRESGKKLGMHGIMHTYNEFAEDVEDGYIQAGMNVFKEAFGYYPTHFKAPKTAMTKNNRKIIERKGMKIMGKINQILHHVYHSEDLGRSYKGRLEGEIIY